MIQISQTVYTLTLAFNLVCRQEENTNKVVNDFGDETF